MEIPFPGMDPYLEAPYLWEGVQLQLVARMPSAFHPDLPDGYYQSIEPRIYKTFRDMVLVQMEYEHEDLVDALIVQRGGSVPESSRPSLSKIDAPEKVKERFAEIWDARTKKLITVVEVLSLAGKLTVPGRAEYLQWREAMIASDVNLVEIDLLRWGERMPMSPPPPPSDYAAMISRAADRSKVEWIGFNVRDSIPTIPIPLEPGKQDLRLDLRPLLEEIYRYGRMGMRISYDDPLVPPLNAETATWADALLREKGLR